MGLEIESIRQIAKASVEANTPEVERIKREFNEGKLATVAITDVDFPTSVYHKLFTNISLFDIAVVAPITEVYRRVNVAHHRKKMNQALEPQISEMLHALSQRVLNKNEADIYHSYCFKQIAYAGQYIQDVGNILSVAEESVNRLKRYYKFDTSKLKIPSNVHSEEFHPRNPSPLNAGEKPPSN